MVHVGPIEVGATPPAAPAPPPANASPPASQSDGARAKPAHKSGTAIDEHTLDQIAQRLIKRDPALSIEKDAFLTSYIYKFLDRDSGNVLRQFPAQDRVATIHALQIVSAQLAQSGASTDLEV